MKPSENDDQIKAGRKTRGSKGMALLLTLAVITLMVATVVGIHQRIRSGRAMPFAYGLRMELYHMASSGIQAAMAVLAQDRADSEVDSVQEDWAVPLFLKNIASAVPFESGEVILAIDDELGKIQINALVKQPEGQQFNPVQKRLWDRLLLYFKDQLGNPEMDFQAENIIDALKDWMDTGEGDALSGLGGAESDYYRSLDPPYTCKNAPMTHLSELALVKGISSELLAALGGIAEISKYLTVYGVSPSSGSTPEFKGKININTAGLPVLAALLPIGEQGLAQAIYDFRADRSENTFLHDLSDPNWYRQAPGCRHLRIDPDLITLSSDIFRIEATAVIESARLKITAVVARQKDESTGKWACKVLSWHTG